MAVSLARSAAFKAVATPRVAKAAARSGVRSSGLATRQSLLAKPATLTQTTRATPIEIAQLAVDGSVVSGSAAVVVACTLIGLALGFVLLRVESLVEEGEL